MPVATKGGLRNSLTVRHGPQGWTWVVSYMGETIGHGRTDTWLGAHNAAHAFNANYTQSVCQRFAAEPRQAPKRY